MSNPNDFEIENGVLKFYKGTDEVVTVPEGVTSIGRSVFCGDWNLTSVTLPEGLKHIGDYAFSNCGKLKHINFPEGLISIGEKAFDCCGLTGSIAFPYGLQDIGKKAFIHTGIKSVVLPESITSIGDEAFEFGCIKNISIPVNLSAIGKNAFLGCMQLKDGNLPKDLNSVGAGAFYGTGITAFSITPENKKFKTINGILLSKTGKKLIMFPPNGDPADCPIPESVEQIGSRSFYGVRKSGYIMLRKNVSIAKSAFKDEDTPFITLFVTVYSAADAAIMTNPIYIGNINDLPTKLKNVAAKGFIYAEEHGIQEIQPYRQSYLEYIRRNIKTYLKDAPENEFLLQLLIEEKLIPAKEISRMIRTADTKGNTVMKAMLLEYQHANPDAKKTDEFSLSDDDPELKRRLKQQVRQEAIKKQKGIQGLSFVATGDFKHFGCTDAYTGAKDMSDLKAFIEDFGGYLRGAVSFKTDYLICNDPNSDSVKSKKAKELGIPVIDEDTFIEMAYETETE